jgi:DNA-binding NarL/FixJ family response regulator
MDDSPSALGIGVVAPDAVTRKGLRAMLSGSPDLNVVWDIDCEPAGLPSRIPPVVVADLDRAASTTERMISDLLEAEMRTAVLIYSYGATLDDLRHAFALGAMGYVLKSDSVELLRIAVRTVARRQYFITPGLSGCLRDVLLTWGEAALTQRERLILSLIADGKSTKAIAQDLRLSPRTVEVHRLHLLRKLEAHSFIAARQACAYLHPAFWAPAPLR